jgi:5-hydroxyisourate hydrolase-like protein (transthyretin family)
LSGYAYPGSTISLSQDNQKVDSVQAKSDASFMAEVGNLTKGIYTFTMVAKDTDGVSSIAVPTTFWIEVNTQTNVANILISPTIKLANTTVNIGDDISVSGQSAPNVHVIVQMSDQSGKKLLSTNKEGSGSDGRWSSVFTTAGLAMGVYDFTAVTSYPKIGSSSPSEKVECGVGQQPAAGGPCAKSDINKDGKVNLVDFSMMLFYWGGSYANADLNADGKIDLIDFSIMMYCWTG